MNRLINKIDVTQEEISIGRCYRRLLLRTPWIFSLYLHRKVLSCPRSLSNFGPGPSRFHQHCTSTGIRIRNASNDDRTNSQLSTFARPKLRGLSLEQLQSSAAKKIAIRKVQRALEDRHALTKHAGAIKNFLTSHSKDIEKRYQGTTVGPFAAPGTNGQKIYRPPTSLSASCCMSMDPNTRICAISDISDPSILYRNFMICIVSAILYRMYTTDNFAKFTRSFFTWLALEVGGRLRDTTERLR